MSLITHQTTDDQTKPTNLYIPSSYPVSLPSKHRRILHTMLHLHQQCVHSGTRKIITVTPYIFLPPPPLSLIHKRPYSLQIHAKYQKKKKIHRILLAYSTVMFILSTTHVSLAVSELLQGFVSERESTPGGPPVFYRFNVFPKRKAIYIVNVCAFFICLFSGIACK